ncbi:MAG TPA: SDR family NAD(P)-dependent oxidoreductase, partial [Amnibacterium sp.]|uniref:SDR family NAD(P)-dependent oxidoreductase n=1 Tax=Amnibacterium sp. TaxID=1872496 RepID=UPI002F952BC9
MTLPPSFDLAGQTALVTGAGSPTGIGFTTALELGRLGADLVVTSTTDRIHDRVAELTAQGVRATGVVARLETEEGVAALVQALGDL